MAALAKPQTKPIEHDGLGPPVDAGTKVRAWLRNGDIVTGRAMEAPGLHAGWTHGHVSDEYDITHYEVLS